MILKGVIENCPVCGGTHTDPMMFFLHTDTLEGAMVQCPAKPGMHYFSLYRYQLGRSNKPVKLAL